MSRTRLCLLLALAAGRAAGDEVAEPPPEAADGDYALEARDSLGRGSMELDLGAGGRVGSRSRSVRRVRFRGEGAAGSLREGDDPLHGGRLDARAAGGAVRVGRLAPRWGRGLVIGGAAEPWAHAANDRGEDAPFVGRAGEGARWVREGPVQAELMSGRFSRRRIAGVRAGHGAFGVAGLVRPGGPGQGSLALGEGATSAELALDGRGRWRGELAVAARDSLTATTLVLRAGHDGFRSLAEPLRSGPARAAAVTHAHTGRAARVALAAAAWSFGPGAAGSRAAIGLARDLSPGAWIGAGLEEQRGPRRPTQSSPGPRRGVHTEVALGGAGRRLALRDEWWGERPWARAAVRRVMAVRADVALPWAAQLTVVHATWRVRPGERLWLADATSDGLVLRSVLGAGERTRLEMAAPVHAGRVRLGATFERRDGSARRPTWTAEWTRRGRL